MNDLGAAARHWEFLADQAEDRARRERDLGLDLSLPGNSPGDSQARLYRRTADALRLEIRTGRPHCACHLQEKCPNAAPEKGNR